MMPGMWNSKPYRRAVECQDVIMECIHDAEPKDKASLAKSFVALEMLKLRLRMKPAPKPIDVSKPKKQGMPLITPEE
jgi:hypothetical protein